MSNIRYKTWLRVYAKAQKAPTKRLNQLLLLLRKKIIRVDSIKGSGELL